MRILADLTATVSTVAAKPVANATAPVTVVKPRMITRGKATGVAGAYRRANESGRAASKFVVADTAAQRLTRMDSNGRLRRIIQHGDGSLITNFAARSSHRPR